MLKNFSGGEHKYRPAPFWSWNDKLNKGELLAQMEKMKEAGYGAFFMHSRVGLVTEYMSDEWLDLVRFCAEKSREYGEDAYLYDEDMWPSGYASGAVPAMSDEFKERALVLIDKENLRDGDEVYKEIEDGGKALFIAKRVTMAGNMRFGGQCYIDAMNPKTIRAFLDVTHERYKEKVGDLFGKEIKGVFTDEPCYGMHWFFTVPHVPFSESLRERIIREKGYDIKDRCDELFFDTGEYKRTRYDYFTLAGNQLRDSFTKQYCEWCENNGLLLTGHFMSEETLYEQAEWTGGVMQNYAYMHQPGVDKLQKGLAQLVTIKQLTSVTEQLNKPRALCECFAGLGHESGFLGRKQIADWQAVNGINFVNMHLSHYSLRGERKRDYPPDIFYQQPYFCEEKYFSDYIARLSQIAGYGKRAVNVLIIQPLGSVFSGYNPNDKQNKEKLKIYDEYLRDLSFALQSNHIDFHYGDEELLSLYGKVEDGKMVVGEHEYGVVILCHNESLRRSTLDLMDKFTGKTIVLGQIPRYCEYREEIDFGYSERYTDVNALVKSLSGEKFAEIEAEGVIGCRRTGKDGDVYLFCNGGDAKRVLRAGLLKGAFALDMSCGAAYSLVTDAVTLYPRGSLAVFTGSEKTLSEWGVAVKEIPVLSADGAEFSDGIYSEIGFSPATAENENALVIDRADFTSGDAVLKDVPLAAIWHYRFYKLPEGAPFTISYKFFVEKIPAEPVELVIENAENADSITLNGKPVQCMRKRGEEQRSDGKSYRDLSFTRCKTDALKAGENEVVIRAKKINNIVEVCTHRHVTEKEHFPTEAEVIYVIGRFSVKRREGGDGFMITSDDAPLSGDVAEGGYPFYSGGLSYEFAHVFRGEQLLLEADCVYACLYIDGKKYVSGGDPLVFDTREVRGEKRVKLTLYNSLYALLGPHHIKGYDDLPWVDPGIFNDLNRYDNKFLIKPFGLKKIKTIVKRSEKR